MDDSAFDIVIIGGGFTGLSSAYNLRRKFPDKKVVVLEGACCGYGASGRNGGFAGAGIPGLMSYTERMGPEAGRKAYDASFYGLDQIKEVIAEHHEDHERLDPICFLVKSADATMTNINDLAKRAEKTLDAGDAALDLEPRRAEWRPRKPAYASGALAKYAYLVSSASIRFVITYCCAIDRTLLTTQ